VKAVCDAGPLIALGKLGQLGLLLRAYSEIHIPRQVYDEVVTEGHRIGAPDAGAVDSLVRGGSIQVARVVLPVPLPAWAAPLDVGETAAILLAHGLGDASLLADNLHARRAAREAGLQPKGTVGILFQALCEGHLPFDEFAALMQRIKSDPTLWISEQLCDEALREATKRQL
jgi:predicted nucleic acid-binding protein